MTSAVAGRPSPDSSPSAMRPRSRRSATCCWSRRISSRRYSLVLPYSPDLTKDLFAFTPEFENLETGSRLNTAEKEAAGELGRIFGLKPVPLEVGATYGYYAIRQDCDPLEASRQVKRLKPFYSEAQIALGISKAKQFLFTPTPKDLEDLKKETGIWQQASIKSLEN